MSTRTYRRTWRRWAERDAHRRFENFSNRRRITLIRGPNGDVVKVVAAGLSTEGDFEAFKHIARAVELGAKALGFDDSWEVRVL